MNQANRNLLAAILSAVEELRVVFATHGTVWNSPAEKELDFSRRADCAAIDDASYFQFVWDGIPSADDEIGRQIRYSASEWISTAAADSKNDRCIFMDADCCEAEDEAAAVAVSVEICSVIAAVAAFEAAEMTVAA